MRNVLTEGEWERYVVLHTGATEKHVSREKGKKICKINYKHDNHKYADHPTDYIICHCWSRVCKENM